MEYSLAKELKDAGFPQLNKEGAEKFDDGKSWMPQPVYIPTLSELIEACRKPKHFVAVGEAGHYPQKWEAKIECWESYHEPGDEVVDWKEGSTPDEAVARLWLALNSRT